MYSVFVAVLVNDCSCQLMYTLGTCKDSRFDSNSNRTIPIRFQCDGPIQNFWIGPSAVVPQTALTVIQKKLQPLRRCNWHLFYVYDLMIYVWAIVQYCLRKHENPHISIRLLLHFIRFYHSFYVRLGLRSSITSGVMMMMMAIGIKYVNDYTLIRSGIQFEFESKMPIRFERKFPIRRSLVHVVNDDCLLS